MNPKSNKDNDKDLDDENFRHEDYEYDFSENNAENSEDENHIEESLDEKRIRLAKLIIDKARNQKAKRDEDDGHDGFFTEDVEETTTKKEIDENDEVTKYLQDKILSKKKQLFTPLFDLYHKSFLDNSNCFQKVHELKGHTNCITSCQFDPLTENLYSVSKDGSIIKCNFF